MIRAFAVVKDFTAPTFWRVQSPFRALQERGYAAHWASSRDPNLGKLLWALRPDVVILPRMAWHEAGWEAFDIWIADLHERGIAVIYEMDDDILSPAVDDHHRLTRPTEDPERMRRDSIRALRACDGVTVSTPHLAVLARDYTDAPVEVVPNLIDLAWWRVTQRRTKRSIPGPTIGWAGGLRRDADFDAMAEAWRRIAAARPDVTFVVQGYQPPAFDDFPPERIRRFDWLPIEQYPLGLVNVDIGCCPLADTPFNRSKSAIKAMEYAASGAAVVASPTVYEDMVLPETSGYLAETVDEWESALRTLLDRPSLRAVMARRLLKTVERHYALDRGVDQWPEAWARLLAQTSPGPSRGAFPLVGAAA